MEEIILDVQLRSQVGTSSVKAIRRSGQIPAVVYGGKKNQPTVIQANRKQYEGIMRLHAGESVLFHINVFEGEKKLRDYSAIVKEEQIDPVTEEVVHIDFHRVSLKEKIDVFVPINVKGEAAGQKKGGAVDHPLWELEVTCLPTDIPQHIDVDISALDLGDAIHVGDLKLPVGVTTKHDPEAVVVSVVHAQQEEEPGETSDALEPELIKAKKEAKGSDEDASGEEK